MDLWESLSNLRTIELSDSRFCCLYYHKIKYSYNMGSLIFTENKRPHLHNLRFLGL